MGVHGNIWVVVGGSDRGGILARCSKDLSSFQFTDRLESGSVVVATEHDEEAGRLRYELLAGAGPASGWVSTHLQGRELLVRTSQFDATEDDAEALKWYSSQLQRNCCGDASAQDNLDMLKGKTLDDGLRDAGESGSVHRPEGDPLPGDAQPPFDRPRVRMTSTSGAPARPCGRAVGLRSAVPRRHRQPAPKRPTPERSGTAAPSPAPEDEEGCPGSMEPEAGCGARQEGELAPAEPGDFSFCGVSPEDLEEPSLCTHCGMPVGDLGYADEQQELMHAECQAQLLLLDLQKEASARRSQEASLKQARRAKYGIGWEAARVPRNAALAGSLRCGAAPRGLFCLVLEREPRAVRVVPTIDPRSSVNLEYLALALHVRALEGREPLFSLDPEKDFECACDGKSTMQRKRFEPEWLSGTSAGEVMFQADYYLKELSMGEHDQPVVGMKNCFDFSAEGGCDGDWRAREWFVIKKADILLSEGNVLTPVVKMGVEAREQVQGPHGFEDAKITRPDHPLVKYAEAFTHYFDLIAERRSAVYHLREMAKATVLAKFLVEDGLELDDTWFRATDLIEVTPDPAPKVPQLWNERLYSEVRVRDGAIVEPKDGFGTRTCGVYGGIEFGLEEVTEFGASRVTAGVNIGNPIQAHVLAKIKAGTAVDLSIDSMTRFGAPRVTALTASGVSIQPTAVPSGKAKAAMAAVAPQGAVTKARSVETARLARPYRAAPRRGAKGVDLGLDGFDLSAPDEITQSTAAGGWAVEGCVLPETHIVLSRAFWSSLGDTGSSVFSEDDRRLLRALFDPHLSDRRQEGDLFTPPDASSEYVQRLRELLKEEEETLKRRKDHFLSKDFTVDNPGPLFPSSWASTFGVQHREGARESSPPGCPKRRLVLQDSELAKLGKELRSAAPAFDQVAEDGLHFRVYKLADLEVRTLQSPGDEEVVAAAFSLRSAAAAAAQRASVAAGGDQALVVKVTEYVERQHEDEAGAEPRLSDYGRVGASASSCHYYAVLETESGEAIMTEKCANGRVTWAVNPKGLEARNSLARVTGCLESHASSLSAREVKLFQLQESRCSRPGASAAERRAYTRSILCLALQARLE